MREVAVPLVPGPTRVLDAVLKVYATNLPSADLEPEFIEDYVAATTLLKEMSEWMPITSFMMQIHDLLSLTLCCSQY